MEQLVCSVDMPGSNFHYTYIRDNYNARRAHNAAEAYTPL